MDLQTTVATKHLMAEATLVFEKGVLRRILTAVQGSAFGLLYNRTNEMKDISHLALIRT